jgi:hypothetical protein
MVRKAQLEYQYSPEFRIIGIFSPVKDYRLAWLINQQLGYDLKRLPVFNWKPQGSEITHDCNVFRYENPERYLKAYLVGNRTPSGTILQDPRNLDYLLLLKKPGAHIKIPEMIKSLRGIGQVQMAALLDKALDKTTTAFLFDMENFLATR